MERLIQELREREARITQHNASTAEDDAFGLRATAHLAECLEQLQAATGDPAAVQTMKTELQAIVDGAVARVEAALKSSEDRVNEYVDQKIAAALEGLTAPAASGGVATSAGAQAGSGVVDQ